MLKNAKEKDLYILTVDDYVELFGKPNETFGEQDQQLLYRLIQQATTQIDTLVSPHGQVGTLYSWWNNLKDNDIDNSKGFRLQKAIGSWVETMVQTGKFWVDGVPQLASNIDYNINASYSNSNIEVKRLDIIQDLIAIGLAATTNIAMNEVNSQELEQEAQDLLIYSKDYLVNNYLSLNSMGNNQALQSGINFAELPIINGGDISNTNVNKRTITNYRLQSCLIDCDSDNNRIVGVNNAKTTDRILDPNTNEYKYINNFDIHYWNGLTQTEIYNAIAAAGVLWSPNNIYRQDYIVVYKVNTDTRKRNKDNQPFYGYAKSLINDNIGNDPNNSPDAWEVLPFEPTNLQVILDFLTNKTNDINNALQNELTNQINQFKQDTTNNLIPNEITNQLNQIKAENTIKLYSAGEILYFSNKADFNKFINEYKLVEHVSFEYVNNTLDDGMISNKTYPIGITYKDTLNIERNPYQLELRESYLQQNQLPNVEYNIFIDEYDSNGSGINVFGFVVGKNNATYIGRQSYWFNLNTETQQAISTTSFAAIAIILKKDIVKDISILNNSAGVSQQVQANTTAINNANTQINQNKIDIQQLNNNDNELWSYLDTNYISDNNILTKPNNVKRLMFANFAVYNDKLSFSKMGWQYSADNNVVQEGGNQETYKTSYIDNTVNTINTNISSNTDLANRAMTSAFINGDCNITDLNSGDCKCVKFQLNVSSHREQGYVWASELPQEIKNLQFDYIESLEYSLLQTGSGETKYKCFSPYVANIAAAYRNNQLVLMNESAIPDYIDYVRVKIVINS